MIPENLSSENIQIFLLMFVRIIAMISLLPVFGSQNVPIQIKGGLSFILALILFPFMSNISVPAGTFVLTNFIFMVIKELFVGITIGFASSMLFVAVQFAGKLIDNEMGFALIELIDPFTDAESTVTGQLQILLFTIIFLLINGHFFMLIAVKKSFEVIPLFAAHMPSARLASFFVSMIGSIFSVALRLAAPVFCVLFLTTLALGVVARTVPQMNIFFVGLPLKIGLGLISLAIVLPAIAALFRTLVDALIQDLWKLLFLIK